MTKDDQNQLGKKGKTEKKSRFLVEQKRLWILWLVPSTVGTKSDTKVEESKERKWVHNQERNGNSETRTRFQFLERAIRVKSDAI